jgi:threonine/homoserine efflux transporter RhtA
MSAFVNKIYGMLSEGESTVLSWGRCGSLVAMVASICWVTYLVIRTHTMPDLSGVTAYTVAPYSANKITDAVKSFGGKTNP